MSPRAGSSAASHLALPAVMAGQGKLVPSPVPHPCGRYRNVPGLFDGVAPRGGKPVLICSQIPGNLAHLSGFDKYQLCRGRPLCCGTSPLP